MTPEIIAQIEAAKRVVIIQGENPDGDSIGSSLALDDILSARGAEVSVYCAVDVPKYLRYIPGWDRIVPELDTKADLAIVVDTASDTLLSKIYHIPDARHFLDSRPVIVLDHHASVVSSLSFEHTMVADGVAVATGEMVYDLAVAAGWDVSPYAATCMVVAILSDSLGLTTVATTAKSVRTIASLVDRGAILNEIEMGRRELMKKSSDILRYKGELIGRIEYLLEGKLATVHIPWDDIQKYSDAYNPSVLVLDEMRLVENVEIAIAIKTYPDGKLTGKIRCNTPIADSVAGYFGGGGHPYSAGFRVYESYDIIMRELVTATIKALEDYHARPTTASHDHTI
jgi:bifunctional oligoribonuclease and PAP phosphatase NrnA